MKLRISSQQLFLSDAFSVYGCHEFLNYVMNIHEICHQFARQVKVRRFGVVSPTDAKVDLKDSGSTVQLLSVASPRRIFPGCGGEGNAEKHHWRGVPANFVKLQKVEVKDDC